MKFLKFKDLKIRKKFIVLYLVIFLPVVAVLGWWQIKIQTKTLLTNSIENYRREADAVMHFITFDVYKCLENLPSFTESPVFKGGYSVDEIALRMQKWVDRYKYLSISYFDINRVCIADTDNIGIGKKHPMEGFWEDVMAGKVSCGKDFRLGPERKIPVLYFAAPVKGQKNELTGVIVIRYNFKEFSQIADIIKDKDVRAVLFDRNGKVIYSTCKKYRDYILSDKLQEQPSLKNALRGEEGFVFEYRSFHKMNYLSVYVQEKGFKDFEGNKWKLVLSVEKDKVFFPIKSERNKLIILFFIIAIMIIFSGYYISGLVLRPLKKLSDTVALIRTGDLNKRAEIVSKDEIGLLSDSFNKMTEEQQVTNKNLKMEITERKKMEEELERKNKELESFVYTTSHDLRAPLVSIEGFSSTLTKEYKDKLDDNAKHYLERIGENVKQMAELIQDLLELSRIGRVAFNFEKVDTGKVIGDAIKDFQLEIEKKNIETIYCDKARIMQVLSNLISNAIKFIGDTQKPEIEVGVKNNEDNFCELWVKDNGIGIKKEYQEKIFKIFERIDKRIKGTGIGLSIVKKIVEAHAGRIGVDSEEGKGSRFYFILPEKGGK